MALQFAGASGVFNFFSYDPSGTRYVAKELDWEDFFEIWSVAVNNRVVTGCEGLPGFILVRGCGTRWGILMFKRWMNG